MSFLTGSGPFFSAGAYDSNASSNYDISTGDFTLNWWMYAPTGGPLSIQPATGPIVSFASTIVSVSGYILTLSAQNVVNASGDLFTLSGDVVLDPSGNFLVGASGSVVVTPYGDVIVNTAGNNVVNIFGEVFTLCGSIVATPSGDVEITKHGGFAVTISGDQGLNLKIDGTTSYLNVSVSPNTWQFCTLTRNTLDASGIRFFINGSNTYNSLVTTEIIGNAFGNVCIGNRTTTFEAVDNTSFLNGLMLTNFRWVTGYSDPSAALIPTAELTNISGSQLLFTMMNNASASVWSNEIYYDTSMTAIGSQVWSGLNPFQTINLSWGAPHPRAAATFTGSGFPPNSNLVMSAISGDIYINTASRLAYVYDGANWN